VIDKERLIEFLEERILKYRNSIFHEDVYNTDECGRIISYIKKGEFDLKDKNINEWRTLEEEIPRLNQEAEIELNNGKILRSKFSIFNNYYAFITPLIYPVDIKCWRPIPQERKPDFGSLREGDMVIFYTFDDMEKIEYCSFIVDKKNDDCIGFSFRADMDPDVWIHYEDIKKITRINLETKEFEEI
jgi:hypothetical protein